MKTEWFHYNGHRRCWELTQHLNWIGKEQIVFTTILWPGLDDACIARYVKKLELKGGDVL